MTSQLEKWLRYFSPLFRGRFDFLLSSATPCREAWHQGLGLTGGRFWVRVIGGHDLRRTISPVSGWKPSLSDALVGRSDGPSASVTTFPWVNHAAGANYGYGLTVVGAGGVADAGDAPVARASFDDEGALVGPAPNAACDLAVESVAGGRFILRWTYDERDEEAAPAAFRLFNDAGSPGEVNHDTVVATAPYRTRRGYFNWTSDAFAGGSRVRWAVRAVSADGAEGPASNVAFGVAAAAMPDAPWGILLHATEA
ncbi:MAG: hypothetical protein ABII12_14330 [Planctomycetota bacterium]